MNPIIAQTMRNEDEAVAAIVDAFAAAADDLPVWDSAEDELERRIRSYVNQK